jgi:hypothetical protein
MNMLLEFRANRALRRKYILFPLLKLFLTIVLATICGIIWFDIKSQNLLFVVGFGWAWVFLVHLLPLIIIAYRHHQSSQRAYFAVDTINHAYRFEQNDIVLSFRADEIDKVIKIVSPPRYDKRIDILGFGYFFYWQIVLLNGKTLSLSCMLLDDEVFQGKQIGQQKRIFPVPPSNRHLR